MQKQEFLYKGPNHAANLNDMRLKDKYCDVTIKVDGKEIRAHKVILAANLKYFETMFSSDSFQESHGGVITMESVEKADLELFVSYAYTGEILLTDSNALNLLELANYLSEDGIKEACVEFLEKHLKAEEACRAYMFADIVKSSALKNATKAKIIANFGICLRSDDYLNFDFESLIDILSDAQAQSIQLKKMLLEGIMKWIMHDAKNRKIALEDLLSSIDVAKLNGDEVMSCFYKNLVHRNDEYGITRDAIIYYETSKIERKEQKQLVVMGKAGYFQFYNFIEKKWSSEQKITDAAGNIHESSAVLNDKLYFVIQIFEGYHLQVFDPSLKQITSLYSSSSILRWATLCACDRFLYICGGVKTDNSRSNQVLRCDPQTNSFVTLTSMTHERSSTAAIIYQGYLYVLGGCSSTTGLQLVEKYDPARNEWTAVASMCKQRFGPAAAELDGKLYACGGYSDVGTESSIEVYDPVTDSWQLVASMNKARCYFLLVAYENKLLAIGGDGEKTAEWYDPSKDQWQMDEGLSSVLQEGFYADKLLAIGGAEEKTVEVYDPSKNQWRMDGEMSAGLQADCCTGGLIPSICIDNV